MADVLFTPYQPMSNGSDYDTESSPDSPRPPLSRTPSDRIVLLSSAFTGGAAIRPWPHDRVNLLPRSALLPPSPNVPRPRTRHHRVGAGTLGDGDDLDDEGDMMSQSASLRSSTDMADDHGEEIRLDDATDDANRSSPDDAYREFAGTDIEQHVTSLMYRHQRLIMTGLVIGVGFCILWACLFANAVIGTALTNGKCDRPLDYYLFVMLGGSVASRLLDKQIARSLPQNLRPAERVRWTIISSIPGWIILCWGVTMVQSCETCQKEDPRVYYSLKAWIYFQVGLAIFSTLFVSVTFQYFICRVIDDVRMASRGCEEVVRKLPKVPESDARLEAEECPCCCEKLSCEAAVLTKCGHAFHENCLAEWCKNHTTCPLCRASVAEPHEEAAETLTDEGSRCCCM
mmetsp:Transcript_62666/g.149491  ORF Transcript_62666/g.149491 Transcript_62666/m.149491 type:complete len:400 (-) Transcript_62666:354-1553(-)|eukprot:CAMPEP_0178390130 /NCGR_PEP_ID=MMETSP0689_2-20121128/10486_1 /TAXON_ID=160604 /ORGANISM="Amphidinium massartii, Strain CS-259" /LENGTH=399 /DNA_ID=CAMNT_0020010627 /DNA_START=61 /DNA_END=1260 /DNA_ORIENTATION=-